MLLQNLTKAVLKIFEMSILSQHKAVYSTLALRVSELAILRELEENKNDKD